MRTLTTDRRTAIALLCGCAALNGCLYDRFFDLEWDEEVQLHDGRVIVVHIKHRYMRIEQGLTRYAGVSVPIDSTLTLNTNSSAGTVVQYFKGFHPIFLDQYEGTWYAVLAGKYYPGSRETPGQDWGEYETDFGHLAIRFINQKWLPMNLCDLPDNFKNPNIIRPFSEVEKLAVFDKRVFSLQKKEHHLIDFPYSSVDRKISKPRTPRFACRSISNSISKEATK